MGNQGELLGRIHSIQRGKGLKLPLWNSKVQIEKDIMYVHKED